MYTVTVKTDGTKTVQSKRYSDLLSFQLHLIIDFVLTQRKLAHSPVKFPARSISHFAMNIIMAKHWFNRQSKFRQMTYFQQSAKLSSRQNFRPYGISAENVSYPRLESCCKVLHYSVEYCKTRPPFCVVCAVETLGVLGKVATKFPETLGDNIAVSLHYVATTCE